MNDGSPSPDPLAGFYCPGCDYDLTGLSEHRCPECGAAFDVAALRIRFDTDPQPIQPWHRYATDRNPVFAYLWTALQVIAHPTQFAAGFPRVCKLGAPMAFGMVTRLIAVTPIILAPAGSWVLLVIGANYIGVTLVFNLLLAGCCRVVCRTRPSAPLERYAGWFALLEFGTCFMPIAVAAGLIAGMVVAPLIPVWGPGNDPQAFFHLASGAVFLWSWAWLSRVIAARILGVSRLVVVLAGVPFCAVLSCVVVACVVLVVAVAMEDYL